MGSPYITWIWTHSNLLIIFSHDIFSSYTQIHSQPTLSCFYLPNLTFTKFEFKKKFFNDIKNKNLEMSWICPVNLFCGSLVQGRWGFSFAFWWTTPSEGFNFFLKNKKEKKW